MKLRTRVLTGILASALVATVASANMHGNSNGNMHGNSKGSSCGKSDCMMKGNNKGYHGEKGFNKGGYGVFALINDLNLSDEQSKKIEDIINAAHSNKESQFKAFSENSFNKKEYIQNQKNKREAMLNKKADVIEKVYKVLDSKQKKQLKVLMDMQDEKMNQYKGM